MGLRAAEVTALLIIACVTAGLLLVAMAARGGWRAYRTDRANGRPPWWVWFEPPRAWPRWLHARICTYCRGFARYVRELERTP